MNINQKLNQKHKRTIYIILVMVLVAFVFTLLFLIFILINTSEDLIYLSQNYTRAAGVLLATLGVFLGYPIGKKWWQIVYKEKHKGLVLRVKG